MTTSGAASAEKAAPVTPMTTKLVALYVSVDYSGSLRATRIPFLGNLRSVSAVYLALSHLSKFYTMYKFSFSSSWLRGFMRSCDVGQVVRHPEVTLINVNIWWHITPKISFLFKNFCRRFSLTLINSWRLFSCLETSNTFNSTVSCQCIDLKCIVTWF